jgi:hypothetical protein
LPLLYLPQTATLTKSPTRLPARDPSLPRSIWK